MARPPVGKAAQQQTQTALFAFVAARMNRVDTAELDGFFHRLGLTVGANGARRAARDARSAAAARGLRPPFEERFFVDEHALGLEKVVIRVPGVRTGQGRLRARVLALSQVRQLIEGETTGDLYAIAVVRNGEERRALRAQLDELSEERPDMEPVAYETHAPARRLWRHLTRMAAPHEGLAL